jgi:hypothetical protein
MYILTHESCDGHSVWAKFRSKPTPDKLKEHMKGYSWENQLDTICAELLRCGGADVENSGDCDSFQLEKI